MGPNDHTQKRKRFDNAKMQQGGKRKKRDMGRAAYNRLGIDRREENENRKKQRAETGEMPIYMPEGFTAEEIAAEERRPKKKVAVMIGYSGSGYRGMQINTSEKTIEGDLFAAFVKAGAISKANADDPKKSNLVRCARTDKGVHAAGNVISLKLIAEDENIVEKINAHLSPQIRVWGIIRTIRSFSCYQSCDSRWYEYLIPTHAFLPPHPRSILARRLREAAEKMDDVAGYESRQEEVADFWTEAEKTHIQPVIDSLDEDLKPIVHKALWDEYEAAAQSPSHQNSPTLEPEPTSRLPLETKKRLEAATKLLRRAYLTAKRTFRIPQARLDRLSKALESYHGLHPFHNYTIMKSARDPSAKRLIRSFAISGAPMIIGDAEWVSMRVHGQSFMMHQIRKMVGMAALVVRCGCPISRIEESFGAVPISIPKAPGLGLLLERPVFDTYNSKNAPRYEKDRIEFTQYEEQMTAFKQREIYERMWREEEESGAFHTFMAHVDNVREVQYMFLGGEGIEAVKGLKREPGSRREDSGDDEEDDEEAVRRGEGDG